MELLEGGLRHPRLSHTGSAQKDWSASAHQCGCDSRHQTRANDLTLPQTGAQQASRCRCARSTKTFNSRCVCQSPRRSVTPLRSSSGCLRVSASRSSPRGMAICTSCVRSFCGPNLTCPTKAGTRMAGLAAVVVPYFWVSACRNLPRSSLDAGLSRTSPWPRSTHIP